MSGMAGVNSMLLKFLIVLKNLIHTITGAEKQPATNKQEMFVDNFGLTPASIYRLVSC
jgi:hypothetical protein